MERFTDPDRAADRECMRRMGSGDTRALAELFDRYGDLVHSLALRIVGVPEDAEEVAADVFGRLWSSAVSFDPGRGSVPGWLAVVTRNLALDRVRAGRRREAAIRRAVEGSEGEAALPVSGAGPLPDEVVGAAEVGARLREAVDSLPGAQRQAIHLAYFGGLTHSEIARELGEPLGTVKTRIRAGMARLREMLEPVRRAEP